ncbi:MAG: Asp-tRNA(Asn)/Glu-tRNA(Gln) amidotransferase GatCAB subunit A, partial [Anaerolineae bacterium]
MSSDLTSLTVLEALAALRKGEVSSRELTQACLERIERLEPQVHAFLHVAAEYALKAAAEADRARAAGEE